MSSQMFKRFISYVGKTKLTDLPKDWQKTVDEVLVAQEKANPQITKAEIKGAQPHKSHKDPSDPLDVISVRLLKDSGSRVDSIHIHQDGTSKRK
ncbi:MAG: hypothetical protein Q9164_005190 [Protoblastenia rupestris]